MRVALATLAALTKNKLLIRLPQIRQRFECPQIEVSFFDRLLLIGIGHPQMKLIRQAVNERAHRNLHHGGPPVAPVFVLALTVPATQRAQIRLVVQRDKIVHLHIGLENDVAALAPIAAIRPPARDEFFPAKTTAAIAAVPGLGLDADLINKFHTTVMGDEWPIAND